MLNTKAIARMALTHQTQFFLYSLTWVAAPILPVSGDDDGGYVRNLFGVTTVSSQEAWAVGQRSNQGDDDDNDDSDHQYTILHWNGTTWVSFPSPTNTRLNSIYMLDSNGDGLADSGWAVGNNGRALAYNGSSWTQDDISADISGTPNFFSVVMFAPNDVWAVGAGGRRVHFDGNNWTLVASGGGTLRGVAAVGAKRQATYHPLYAWREIFR